MTAICPNGHEGADDEFCEVCGLAIDNASGNGSAIPSSTDPAESAGSGQSAGVDPAGAAPDDATCRSCGAPLDGRFCEACGADSLATAPNSGAHAGESAPTGPPPGTAEPGEWTVVVTADRAYFDQVKAAEGPDAGSVTFPPYCPDRYFPLRGQQVTIGRRSASRGIVPGIDLTGPPEDPGVSRLHAAFVAQPDGSWSIVDLDSANGTTVNSSPDLLRPNLPRPVADGDRVHVGAWTTIILKSPE